MSASLLLILAARAAAPTLTPTDGVIFTDSPRPAWAIDALPVPAPPALAPLQAEVDQAWRDRADLDPESARRRIHGVVVALVPTLTVEQRDLLQRSLFLEGVLDIDAAGGLAALPNGVQVGGAMIPAPWIGAIAVSPGASAPVSADTSFAVQAYDAARTALVAEGGPRFDPGAEDLDVRLDGQPIRAEVQLLPGVHTVSLHEAGHDPVAMLVRVGGAGEGQDVAAVQGRLDQLAAFVRTGEAVPAEQRAALHATFHTPMVLVRTESGSRELWLVDGLARWGRPTLSLGVEAGATGLVGGWSDTPTGCEGGLDHGTKLLVPAGLSVAAGLGPWRARLGGGVVVDAGDDAGFALAETAACDGVERPASNPILPWGWLSVGRRVRVGARGEVEPNLRVGFSSVLLHAEAGLRVPLTAPGTVHVELAPHAGLALNAWSGDAHREAFVGGLDTTLLFGGR